MNEQITSVGLLSIFVGQLVSQVNYTQTQGFSVKKEKEEKTPEPGKVNCPKNQPRQVNDAVYHIETQ